MKTSLRWVLFLAGIVILSLSVHYFLVPLWASHPVMDWRSHRFGPRMFLWGSFIGLMNILIIGFVWYKLLFPSYRSQSTKAEEDLYPYYGQTLQQSETDSKKPSDFSRIGRT